MAINKGLIILICAVVCIVLLVGGVIWLNLPQSVTSIHINSGIVRLESDMSKRLSITVNPEKTDNSAYELVSENEFVAVCDGDNVISVNEGETYVYARSLKGDAESNRVKVVVSNDLFKVAAKIVSLVKDNKLALNSAETELEKVYAENKDAMDKDKEFEDVKITPEKVEDIVEEAESEIEVVTASAEQPEIPAVVEEDNGGQVYVTPSGGKFHLSTCPYAKNATPVSRSKAISDGKAPCKKCNP